MSTISNEIRNKLQPNRLYMSMESLGPDSKEIVVAYSFYMEDDEVHTGVKHVLWEEPEPYKSAAQPIIESFMGTPGGLTVHSCGVCIRHLCNKLGVKHVDHHPWRLPEDVTLVNHLSDKAIEEIANCFKAAEEIQK